MRSGSDHYAWKGGRAKTSQGYVVVLKPDHPYCYANGYILEHRLVEEKKQGRYLTNDDIVHHKNGIRDDNRPENLVLKTRKTHPPGHTPEYFDIDQWLKVKPTRLSWNDPIFELLRMGEPEGGKLDEADKAQVS